ncbi:MAG: hypothetical protein Q4F95_07590 [Oscillospiraceae bacterium]|nr:hypothetical protein [Oscillospiraceae bacterium]
MKADFFETDYKNFGRCACLDNGTVRIMATVDVGPRIIFFGLSEGKNVLFEDEERHFSQQNGEFGTWYAYGGHRIWCAPEVLDETYFPDNKKVTYSYTNGVLILEQEKTGFGKQFSLSISFTDENTVHVENSILNCSDRPQKFAPWSVTGLAPGGTEVIKLCSSNNGFLPNRTMALWSYSDINDRRFRLSNDTAVLSHDSMDDSAFKAGFNLTDGKVTYINDGLVFTKSFDGYNNNYNYPDFGCNFETYTNRYFLECEILGDYREYSPLEKAIITEDWSVRKACSTDQV